MPREFEQIVYDRNGRPLHVGTAISFKAFIERLVQAKQSLAGADLSNHDLSGLELENGVFDDALLDGADLRRTSLRYASLNGASLRGVTAQGLLAERASLMGADLGPDEKGRPSHFEGARFAYASLERRCEPWNAFGEDAPLAILIATSPARQAGSNVDWRPLCGKIAKLSIIGTMPRMRPQPARWAYCMRVGAQRDRPFRLLALDR